MKKDSSALDLVLMVFCTQTNKNIRRRIPLCSVHYCQCVCELFCRKPQQKENRAGGFVRVGGAASGAFDRPGQFCVCISGTVLCAEDNGNGSREDREDVCTLGMPGGNGISARTFFPL